MTRDDALIQAMTHFLSAFPDDKTAAELMTMIGEQSDEIIVWEPFADYPADWLVEQITSHAISLGMPMSRDEWVRYGYENGYCGPAICETHDGFPMSEAESNEFNEGNDPCLHMVRLYDDAAHKAAVEANDAPSQWRASNEGLV